MCVLREIEIAALWASVTDAGVSGGGGRRDEAGGTIRAGSTSGVRGGEEPAGSGAALWDRPADGGEDAGVLGAARVSAEPAAGAAQAGSVCWDHRADPGGG